MLTEKQRHQNYLQLVETCKFFDDNSRITEEWCYESMYLIQKYRQWIPDYSKLNEEIADTTFRQLCSDSETLMRSLNHLVETKWILDTYSYSLFVHKLKDLCDFLLTLEESSDEGLAALMKNAHI